MTVAKYEQPNYLTDTDASDYKGKIDGGMAALAEVAANFAPHEAATPDMTVMVDAGKLFTSSYIAKTQQATALLVAPVTNPRIDRIAIDTVTGDLVVITGVEAVSPVAPDYAESHYPVCQLQLEPSPSATTSITNSMINDERPLIFGGSSSGPNIHVGKVNGTTNTITEIYNLDGLTGWGIEKTNTGEYNVNHPHWGTTNYSVFVIPFNSNPSKLISPTVQYISTTLLRIYFRYQHPSIVGNSLSMDTDFHFQIIRP